MRKSLLILGLVTVTAAASEMRLPWRRQGTNIIFEFYADWLHVYLIQRRRFDQTNWLTVHFIDEPGPVRIVRPMAGSYMHRMVRGDTYLTIMKSDINGASTTQPGEEQFETYTHRGIERVQYDYRTPDGELFSTVAPTLKVARRRRDEWLQKRMQRVTQRGE